MPQSSPGSSQVASVFYQVVCQNVAFRASLSSDVQDVGSLLAGRASSATLLAAGVLLSTRTALWTRSMWPAVSLGECSSAVDQCNFVRDVPSEGLCIGFGIWLLVLLLDH